MKKRFADFIAEGTSGNNEVPAWAKRDLANSFAAKNFKSPNNGVIGKNGGFLIVKSRGEYGDEYMTHFVKKYRSGWEWYKRFTAVEIIPVSDTGPYLGFSDQSHESMHIAGKVTAEKIFAIANDNIAGSVMGKAKTFLKLDATKEIAEIKPVKAKVSKKRKRR